MSSESKSLCSLPNELLVNILLHIEPEDSLSISRTSKRLRQVADEPILWRKHCINSYRHWARRHHFTQKLQSPPQGVDWKALLKERRASDRVINSEFHGILNYTARRIPRIEKIVDFEGDAKDAMLKHVREEHDSELPLARHFWSKQILHRLGRGEAINTWTSLARGEEMDHALALSAYDVFVLGYDSPVDPSGVDHELQLLADELRSMHPDWSQLNTRSRALKLAEFLANKDFLGIRDHDHFHNLPNNFISLCLTTQRHEALPIVCAVIYCSIARRVGIKAEPINYPLHVYVSIQAPMGVDLNGKPSQIVELTQQEYEITETVPGILYKVQDSEAVAYRCMPDSMYIDAFRLWDEEVSIDTLKQGLTRLGVSSGYHSAYLRPSSTRELIHRTRNNILESLRGHSFPYAEVYKSSIYSTAWVHLVLPASDAPDHQVTSLAPRRRSLPIICEALRDHCPWDVDLVETHILTLFRNHPEYGSLLDVVQTIRFEDITPQPKQSRRELLKTVKYKVGQVFRHRTHAYTGMIIGWDTRCLQDQEWIDRMEVDRLRGGRNQCFYNVMYVLPIHLVLISQMTNNFLAAMTAPTDT